ncbi:MAG TPA: PD-(D/E)XK nuclease family protein [Coleofasciculaceae cyanobacterium]
MLHLSQGLLNLFATCPRKFQHIYLDQLNVPIASAQQKHFTWGNRFHLRMQQQELGLRFNPIESEFDPADQQIHELVDTFVQSVPELFQPHPTTCRQSEHQRSLQFQGYWFTVIYDLLILDEQQAQILDWKTYPRPQKSDGLAHNWQTRLYPFVLAETSHYLPEQISMTYWFVQAKQGQTLKPECLKFSYSQSQHQQVYQELADLLRQLTGYLQQYQAVNLPFPQVPSDANCEACTFALRCQREPRRDRLGTIATLEEIPEVGL